MPARILIVDDEPNITRSFSSLLADEGYEAVVAQSAEEALTAIGRSDVDLVLLDIQLPGKSGLECLREISATRLPVEVLMISGQADIPMALEAVRLGAVDFLEKPVSPEKLIASVKAALLVAEAARQRRAAADDLDRESPMVGESAAMKRLRNTISQVATADTTVLITGANGTGKELVATRLVLESPRRTRPFIKVNCPGIPETLFESELFGHVKGSFTGAVKDHAGKFVLADGGTIFFDEIGDLPRACQAKLLRVLETGEIETLGSERHRRVDVRVVCATNRDLRRMVADGAFREDLYYRISVFLVDVPTLSARHDDIPMLAGAFLHRFDPTGSTRLSGDALAWLTVQPFPGNVRQLKNLIERICILHSGQTVGIEQLRAQSTPAGVASSPAKEPILSLADQLARFERSVIEDALSQAGGNISEAARILGVDRANLSRKIKDLGLKA
ncbi:MAG: sigma-54 dependent transcriptional regulator [candidate division Zixibacteria bacterium]|jgi:DNA-binding NtrC family response regulator|nr:sigma-54 dependent transcriptional regulator [candidate division Zixibacteria bacterium]